MEIDINAKELQEAHDALMEWEQEVGEPSACEVKVFQAVRRLFQIMGIKIRASRLDAKPQKVDYVELIQKGTEAQKAEYARKFGYTGQACVMCAGFKLIQAGKCAVCQDCGASNGCS